VLVVVYIPGLKHDKVLQSVTTERKPPTVPQSIIVTENRAEVSALTSALQCQRFQFESQFT